VHVHYRMPIIAVNIVVALLKNKTCIELQDAK